MNNRKLYETIMRNVSKSISKMLNEELDNQHIYKIFQSVYSGMMEVRNLEEQKAKDAGISLDQFKKICALYAKYQNKEISDNQMYDFARKILSTDTPPPIPHQTSVKELNDICDMFDNDKESIFSKDNDISEFLSFITADGKQIKLSDYDEDKMDKPAFLKISSPELSKNDNDIIMSLSTDLSISENQLEWMKYDFII